MLQRPWLKVKVVFDKSSIHFLERFFVNRYNYENHNLEIVSKSAVPENFTMTLILKFLFCNFVLLELDHNLRLVSSPYFFGQGFLTWLTQKSKILDPVSEYLLETLTMTLFK